MAEEDKATQGVEEEIQVEHQEKGISQEQREALEKIKNDEAVATALEQFGEITHALAAAMETAGAVPRQIQQAAAEYFRLLRPIIGTMESRYLEYLEGLTAIVNGAEEERREGMAAIKDKGKPKTLSLMATANALAWRVMGLSRILDYMGDYLEQELEKPEYAHLATMADMIETLPEDPGRTWWDVVIESAARALEKENPARYREMLEAMGTDAEESATESSAPLTAATLPVIKSLLPAAHKMLNNKLTNDLQGHTGADVINAGAYALEVFPGKGRRKPLSNYTMITDEGNKALEPYSLTEYERQVIDAVCSLLEEARSQAIDCIITPDMVYRALPGGGGKPSPQQKAAITKAIERFRRIHIFIDASKEMVQRKLIKEGDRFVFDDYLLSAVGMEGTTANGAKKAKGYLVRDVLTLSYAKATEQIYSIPSQVIEVKKVSTKGTVTNELVTMTSERQAITGYILRQIEWMKYGKKHKTATQRSEIITLEEIYRDVGIEEPDKGKTLDIRRFIYSVLEYEKAIKYISSYNEIKTGRRITGVKIEL
jgi:hypothetical protein